MKTFLYILIIPILFSCGGTQFAKRKYTKGVYVEKRGKVKDQRPVLNGARVVIGNKKGIEENFEKSKFSSKKSELSHKTDVKEGFIAIKDEKQNHSAHANLDYDHLNLEQINSDDYTPIDLEEDNQTKKIDVKNPGDVDPHFQALSISSVVLGALAILLIAVTYVLAIATLSGAVALGMLIAVLVVSIVAVILAAIVLKWRKEISKPQKRMAIAGLVMGLIGLLFSLVMLILGPML